MKSVKLVRVNERIILNCITGISNDNCECIEKIQSSFVSDVLKKNARAFYYLDSDKKSIVYECTDRFDTVSDLIKYMRKLNSNAEIYVCSTKDFEYADDVIEFVNGGNVEVLREDWGFDISEKCTCKKCTCKEPAPDNYVHIVRWENGKKVFDEEETDPDKMDDVYLKYAKKFWPKESKLADDIASALNSDTLKPFLKTFEKLFN